MTCEEFERIVSHRVTDVTRAERLAALSHMDECESCRATVTSATGPLPEERKAEIDRLQLGDIMDPEYIEQLLKGKP